MAASLVGASAWAHGNTGTSGTTPSKGTTSTQGTQSAAGPKAADQQVLREAYNHSSEQLAIGELATRQGQNEQVKKIGQQIVTDETNSLQRLRKVAEKQGMPLPQAPPAQDMSTVSRLSKLQGKQFDDAFLAQVRARNDHALQAFEHEAKNGKNDDLKSYANQQVPVIRGPLDQIKTGVANMQKGTTNQQPSNKNPPPAKKEQPKK